MKWKAVWILCGLAILGVGGVAGLVLYYHFDWSEVSSLSFYQNLANPSVRIVRIQAGWRKEQVAAAVATKLGWDEKEQNQFIGEDTAFSKWIKNAVGIAPDKDPEGHYFPKSYLINIHEADPETVSSLMFNTFDSEMGKVQKPKDTKVINEETALVIASIIQREAAGKGDMRLISGIIWNRLFKGMRLQIDATLQYAKGNEEDGWWPPVDPADKSIDSPYNTYKYASLPPTPIANPSLDAIAAAYNPQKTDCLFYLHDKNRRIHCSITYAQHLKNIDRYY